jgi:hypothetical protein
VVVSFFATAGVPKLHDVRGQHAGAVDRTADSVEVQRLRRGWRDNRDAARQELEHADVHGSESTGHLDLQRARAGIDEHPGLTVALEGGRARFGKLGRHVGAGRDQFVTVTSGRHGRHRNRREDGHDRRNDDEFEQADACVGREGPGIHGPR